jgi:hypothetical protein
MATGPPLSVFPHDAWPGASHTGLLRRETVGGALFAARCFDLAGAQPHLPPAPLVPGAIGCAAVACWRHRQVS